MAKILMMSKRLVIGKTPIFVMRIPYTATSFVLSRYSEHRKPQELQLPQKPPRHEKNAGTDPDGEQHSEPCTDHPNFLSFTLGRC